MIRTAMVAAIGPVALAGPARADYLVLPWAIARSCCRRIPANRRSRCRGSGLRVLIHLIGAADTSETES
jgi:hypothetical protein